MPTKVTVTDPESEKAPWWWRRRIGLTPFYFGLGTAAAGWASFLLSATQVLVVLAAATVAAMWAAESTWSRKKDRAMRNFVWVVTWAAGGFILAVRFSLIESRWLFVAMVVGVLGLGGFWWKDQYNIKRVKVERDQERWPMLAKKLGMPGVRRGPVKETDTGRKWHFWWDQGDYTLAQFKAQARQLESALGIPDNRIRFEHVFEKPGMKSPNAIIVSENTDSPILGQSIKFGEPTMKRFTDPMFIGFREDGTKHNTVWFHQDFGGMHTLAAGSTGSGKSGLYALVMAESAYCPDLVRWGIDAKGGMALRPWASMFDWMVDDVDSGEAYWMLTALLKILIARSKYAASKGWDVWQADKDHPVLLLVVDEAAEVFSLEQFDMNALSASIARMGRGAGVLMLMATQHPTNDALGSTQLTKNLRRRFCFSVEDDHAQRAIIPKSTGRFDASEIPIGPDFAGTYYSSEGGAICDLSGRVRFVSREDIYRLTMTVGLVPGYEVAALDKLSTDAAMQGSTETDEEGTRIVHYSRRRIYTVKDVIKPKGWVDKGDEPWLPYLNGTGAPNRPTVVHAPPAGQHDEPVHAPADEPLDEPTPVAARRLPDEPMNLTKPGSMNQADAPGAPAQAPIPGADEWTTEEPEMNLNELVEPASQQEADELDAAIAAYLAETTSGSVSAEEAQRMLEKILDQAGTEGLAISDMQKVLKRSPSWYSDQLRARLFAKPPTVEKVGSRYRRPRPGRGNLRVVPGGPADAAS